MKTKVKNTVITITFFVLFIVFAALCKYHNITRYDIVSGISVDFSGDKWSVICEICKPSSNDDFGSKTEYVKGTGFTLAKALNNANLHSTSSLYLSSVQLYLIGEGAAEKTELFDYFKSQKSNIRATVAVCEKNAGKILRSESDSNARAKSFSLSHKLYKFCDDNKLKPPTVVNFLKNKDEVYINSDALPERRIG